jgi:chromosome segregation ATPase
MRTITGTLGAALILGLLLSTPSAASEADSYAERSREWVDGEQLQRMIEQQMEIAGPWLEYDLEPLLQEEMGELMEELAPMLEDIQIEVRESMREDMVDVSKILRESLRGIRIDSPRVRVERYQSREERIEEEIQVLERRLESLRKQLKEMDDKF